MFPISYSLDGQTSHFHVLKPGNSRGDPLIRQRLQIILAHLSIPSMRHQVRSERLVLIREIIALDILHEEIGHQNPRYAADSRNDEGPPLPQIVLDRREGLGTNRCAGLAQCGRDPVASTSDSCGIGFRRKQAEHIARAEVARGEHEAVKDDEEGDDLGDLVVGATNDETEYHYYIFSNERMGRGNMG